MIHISKVVEGSSDTDLVGMFLTYFQMSSTTDDSLFKLPHHFQGVAEVAGGFSFTQPVSHSAGQGQVMFVVLSKNKYFCNEKCLTTFTNQLIEKKEQFDSHNEVSFVKRLWGNLFRFH